MCCTASRGISARRAHCTPKPSWQSTVERPEPGRSTPATACKVAGTLRVPSALARQIVDNSNVAAHGSVPTTLRGQAAVSEPTVIATWPFGETAVRAALDALARRNSALAAAVAGA